MGNPSGRNSLIRPAGKVSVISQQLKVAQKEKKLKSYLDPMSKLIKKFKTYCKEIFGKKENWRIHKELISNITL